MYADATATTQHSGFFARSEAWLDARGKGAWTLPWFLGSSFSGQSALPS